MCFRKSCLPHSNMMFSGKFHWLSHTVLCQAEHHDNGQHDQGQNLRCWLHLASWTQLAKQSKKKKYNFVVNNGQIKLPVSHFAVHCKSFCASFCPILQCSPLTYGHYIGLTKKLLSSFWSSMEILGGHPLKIVHFLEYGCRYLHALQEKINNFHFS